jgi:hypothetical protein
MSNEETTPVYFTTELDLRAWVDSAMGCEATPELVDAATDGLRPDGPSFSDDWGPYLDGIAIEDLYRIADRVIRDLE